MGKATVRDLRNHGGRVLDRVAAGELVTITRDGKPVARLAPVKGGQLSAAALIERFRRLPAVDLQRLRADVDAIGRSAAVSTHTVSSTRTWSCSSTG